MTNIEKICPYPGLRAFEAKESLYFKGRDGHIDEIMKKLAANKFLLLTGASGDGKSSLIFAGLIPNCQAGFFKAKFSRWAIVSFRPERSPLSNLAEALNLHLGYKNAEVIENSLKHGYSALVDLYKESPLFVSPDEYKWKDTSDEKRKSRILNASNLLIIVDQFEEIFTNPENFNRKTATATETTQVLVNLLLETSRMAQEQDIPIYIVCTMRSDYLGQCAALRGFPEKIVQSQFYLPRMRRQDIVKAIQEPAALSGNKISERLTQRLLNDTHGGTDMLPVLQHCLHRIWLAADRGKEEMDLIHYAMVGGMVGEQLPKEDRARFEKWFESLPGSKRALFGTASLENVINIHADELYMTAGHDRTSSMSEEDLEKPDARFIIETTFKCLTKIDDNRIIRNLMNFGEIEEMLGSDKYTSGQIKQVIDVFRAQGNTLIRPFITDNTQTAIKNETVLDITHEALIRNWTQLYKWAWQENENVRTYRELRSQLDKWLNYGKRKEHLFSVGSMKYFEPWFKSQKTSPVTWLRRYMWADEAEKGAVQHLIHQGLSGPELDEKAQEHFADITEYLNRSRKNITRKTRLARMAVAAISILLVLVSFAWFQSEKLNKLISATSKANQIATTAYLKLESDPTLAFRLAEAAYDIHPTPLAKQVLLASYGEMAFYKKLEGHTASVNAAIYSPDGKYLLTCSDDNNAILWNNEGKLLTILKGHTASIYDDKSICFSSDSKYIATASRDSTARLWDLAGNCLAIMKHGGAVNSATFAPAGVAQKFQITNNKSQINSNNQNTNVQNEEKNLRKSAKLAGNYFVLTASSDKTARLWDINGNELAVFKGHTKGLRMAKFSPDGTKVLTVAGDTTARVWDLKGKEIKVFKGHKKNINDFVFTKDGQRIITASHDSTAIIWDLSGKIITTLKSDFGYIYSIDISPNNDFIATTAKENLIQIWNFEGKLMANLRGHSATPWSVRFSPDGKLILTSSDDGTARLWDLNGTELMVLRGHTDQILSANFSPDGKNVVTASGDMTARIWNIQPLENPVLKGHTAYVMDANFSPDLPDEASAKSGGKYIATAGYDYTARLWEKSGKLSHILKEHEHYGLENSKFTEDGKLLLTTSGDETVRLWNFEGKQLSKIKPHNDYLPLHFKTVNTKLLVFTSYQDTLRLRDTSNNVLQVFPQTSTGKFSNYRKNMVTFHSDSSIAFWRLLVSDSVTCNKFSVLKFSGTSFSDLEFSPDDKWFITISSDSTLRIWDVGNIETMHLLYPHSTPAPSPLHQIRINAILQSVVFSPVEDKDDIPSQFVSISNDNIIRLWNIQGQLLAEMKGHTDAINDANFSADSKYIVTGSSDFTVRIWDLEGNELQMLTSHTAAVNKAKFSPDGKYILSASNDHTARLMPWRVEDVLYKINVDKVRGDVWEMDEKEREVYGVDKE